jgi:hypothetical protein
VKHVGDDEGDAGEDGGDGGVDPEGGDGIADGGDAEDAAEHVTAAGDGVDHGAILRVAAGWVMRRNVSPKNVTPPVPPAPLFPYPFTASCPISLLSLKVTEVTEVKRLETLRNSVTTYRYLPPKKVPKGGSRALPPPFAP